MDTKGLVRALGEESLLRHVGDAQHLSKAVTGGSEPLSTAQLLF